MKEKVLAVTFNIEPLYHDRLLKLGDEKVVITDKEGKKTTLDKDKKKYPYKLDIDVICNVVTTVRTFSFTIPADYVWNGADIPSILWFFVGSKDNPEFKVPSMVHDFILEYKEYIYKNLLREQITVAEYRWLTSLIFRDLLKTYGTKTVKSNIMSGAVQAFQATFNSKEWKI